VTDTVELPATETYRVSIAGAIYNKPVSGYGPDGQPTVVLTRELALFGQQVELTAPEAARLRELEAVKPADAPLSYDEMDEKQLSGLAKERGIDVRGTGADGAVLKADLINAQLIYDQAQGRAGVPPNATAGATDAQFVEENSAKDVLAEAEGDPGRAQQLLAAERLSDDPRKSVVEGLERIASGE
jgi:hypothetical protein